MKKKLASITALSLALVMTLSACGNNNTKTPSTSADGGTSTSAQAPSQTGTYPGNKNITLYCGYSAGGSSDTLCRLMAVKVGEILGTTCTVENVTGASGWVLWKWNSFLPLHKY